MLWFLVMTMTVGGHSQEYVVDQFHSTGDCLSALRTTKNTRLYRHDRVSFACEKTRIVKK